MPSRPRTPPHPTRIERIPAWGRFVSILRSAETAMTLVILAVLPWVMGGRLELGKFAYATGVAILAVVWLLRRSLENSMPTRWIGVEWLIGAMIGLVLFQIIPLPSSWHRAISPNQEVVIPLWFDSGRSSLDASVEADLPSLQFKTLSFTPEATRFGLLVLVAHALFFCITCQRLDSMAALEVLLRQISMSAIIMSILGLVQYFSGTANYAWIFSHPSREASGAASGPFVNPNHFASYLALGIGPLLWWVQSLIPPKAAYGPTGNARFQSGRGDFSQLKFLAASAGLAIVLFAAGMSHSRGGMLAVGIAVTVFVGCSSYRRTIDWRLGLTFVVLMIVLGASLAIHGQDAVRQEMASLASGSFDELDAGQARRRLWGANLAIANKFPWIGTGVGSHAEVYPMVYDRPHVDYTHAESCYLQILTETGRIGALLLVIAVWKMAQWTLRALQIRHGASQLGPVLAVVSSLVASLVHAVFDFPWYLTGCMSLGVACLAALWRLSLEAPDQLPADQAKRVHDPKFQPQWFLATIGVLVICIPVLSYAYRWGVASWHWNEYLVMSLDPDARRSHRELLVKSDNERAKQHEQQSSQRMEGMYQQLAQVLQWAPRHAAANFKIATLLLAAFDVQQLQGDNAMALVHIRDAAYASKFEELTLQEAWLEKAVGDNLKLLRRALHHARRGLLSSPLSGQGYLIWSEVAFLHSLNPSLPEILLTQGERVRPFHAGIHYQLGLRAANAQDAEGMTAHWQKTFHYDLDYAAEIIRSLSPMVDAVPFMQMFAPHGNELKTLMYYYYKIGKPDQMRIVAKAVIEQTEALAANKVGSELADLRLQLVQHHLLMGDNDGAIREAENAVRAAPNQYEPHIVLATQLAAGQKYEAAIREVTWCVRRRPQDKRVRSLQESLQRHVGEFRVGTAMGDPRVRP
jgi:tetratricopeptide (TPR) repeat protein